MRPATGEWQWSGSFPLATREEYLGLRVRARPAPERAINIPVSTTVGPSGARRTPSPPHAGRPQTRAALRARARVHGAPSRGSRPRSAGFQPVSLSTRPATAPTWAAWRRPAR
jgi:hypothetical protein